MQRVTPSQATFCGDLEGVSVSRLDASRLFVKFVWCPHQSTWDPDCATGQFRNVPTDGIVAEVSLHRNSASVLSVRLRPQDIVTGPSGACPANHACATISTQNVQFEQIKTRALSGDPPENTGTKP
jgi:hypothetical protein